MQYGYSEVCLAHDTGERHPESADRLRAIQRRLAREHGATYVDPPAVERAALTAVHDVDYVDEVESFCAEGGGQWDPDTIAVEESWDAIRQSAGLAVWAAQRALAGDDGRDTPFALGRPPGHHAVVDDAMGFCFVNNVAVAAQAAIDGRWPGDGGAGGDDHGAAKAGGGANGPSGGASEPEPIERVAILDWDVHHGNGTQAIFEDRADVLVASIHEDGIYPGSGDAEEVGVGDGVGATLNVPLPAGSGDAAYDAALRELVGPAVRDLDPDLLLVSAGFDAHESDPISRMSVTTEGYGHVAALVREFAEDVDAGLGYVLEGGYGLEVLADSIRTVHQVSGGYEPESPDDEVGDAARARIDELLAEHPAFDGD